MGRKNFFFLFLSLLFVSSSVAYCPNSCSSPNGVCSTAEVCQCVEGWAGDDCSISDLELTNRVPIDTHVNTRKWRYFHILANSEQQSVKIEVNQTGNGGDIDTYIRLDQYPTRQQWDYRDITTSKAMAFEIPSPHGVYYVGVYGFLGSDFTIQATLKTKCPNDCSGHGTCSSMGVCACREGYVGIDCSKQVFSLTTGEEVSGTLYQNEWRYYRLINSDNTIEITVSVEDLTSSTTNVYVKYNDLPLANNYDYATTVSSQTPTIRIGGALVGEYYIGIAALVGTSRFTLLVTSVSECPNDCSGDTHGSCNSDTVECVCHNGFSGDQCETRDTALDLIGEVQRGYVSDRLWNYYHFNTFTSTNVAVSVREFNEDADCDVFIKAGMLPTRSSYDYRDITFSNNIQLVVENPGVNTWFVGVYGYHNCDYFISAVLSMSCPNNCVDAEHGTCEEGHCICNEPWMGDDCSFANTELENGVAIRGELVAGSWAHYYFDAVPNTQITIALNEEETTGALWLFESIVEAPSLAEHDEADKDEDATTHHVVVKVEEEMRVNIAVYGTTDLGGPGAVYPYRLVVWQAVFPPLHEDST